MNHNPLEEAEQRETAKRPTAPTPEQELEAWLKRPWPQVSRRPASNESDETPSSLELP